MKKVKVNKHMFYFELSINTNVDIFDIRVSRWKHMSLKPPSLLIMLLIFNMELAKDLGIKK